jgi:hypothetical protein
MRVDSITFDGDEPATVTVTMTVAEAATVTKVFGRTVPTTEESSAVYHALTSMLFNAYWEDGVADVPTSLDAFLPKRIELKR